MAIHRLIKFVDERLLNQPGRRLRFGQRLTPGLIRRLQRQGMNRTVRYAAKHSRFYQRKFKEFGIDPRKVYSHADLGNFFTTAADLRNNPVEDFLCAPPEFGFETTGTSMGVNKRVYFSYAEMQHYGRDSAAGLYNLGVRREDVVADGFDYSFWNAPFTAYYALIPLRCLHVIGAFVEPKEFYERVKVYRPTVIMGVPTHIVRVTEVAEKEGIWPVKLLLLGGENLSERTRRYIESVWKGARVVLSYGQTEAFGANGIECPEKHGYHLDDLNLVNEIADPDEDGYGELTYTTLNRQVMPLIRYRSADVTRWAQDGQCQCGLQLMPRVARIAGRSDELINCSMGNISPYWFEEILRDIHDVTDDWQVIVRRGDRDDRIEFHLELRPEAGADEVREHIFRNIEERFPDCWRYYQKRFFEFDFHYHAPRTLSTGRKLRRLIDARRDAWEQ